MNVWKFALLVGFVVSPGFGESFLKATSFPKTFDDLSFKSKVEFMADDYELFTPEYDSDGFCIKNCVYPGLNIVEEHAINEQNTLDALQESAQYEEQQMHLPVDTQNILSQFYKCKNRNTAIPMGQKTPRGEPLIGLPEISSPYGPRNMFGRTYHYGIDYAVPIGTVVYSPANGRVVAVFKNKTCGKGLEIEHEDKIKTIYCHLSKVSVKQGDMVGAGCPIAKSGDSGQTTGAHLHYGMRNSKNKFINPSKYTGRAN